jgi:hypothetical protein
MTYANENVNGVDFILSLQNSNDYDNTNAWEVDSWPNYEEYHDSWYNAY